MGAATFKLEGMPSLIPSIRTLNETVELFFDSPKFKEISLKHLIPKSVPIDLKKSLNNAFPLKKNYDEILSNIKSENGNSIPFVSMGGSEDHAIAIVTHNNQLVVCNRGDGRDKTLHSNTYFDIPSSDITKSMIEELTKTHTKTEDFLEFIKELNLPCHGGFSQKNQKVGNCTWASAKAAFGVLCRMYLDPIIGKEIYKAYTDFVRELYVDEYKKNSRNPDNQLIAKINEKKQRREERAQAKPL